MSKAGACSGVAVDCWGRGMVTGLKRTKVTLCSQSRLRVSLRFVVRGYYAEVFDIEWNEQGKFNLAIEPWADLVVIPPSEHADFEYDEPGDVDFCLMPDGDALVSVMSDRLK